MSEPTVSVIVPAYNSERSLARALESVTTQTFRNWELVIVDDGSTDGTAEIAAGYAEVLKDRFILVQQPHRGASSARNAGIDVCRGRFVAFLDADDQYLPTKLKRQLELFEREPDLGFVYCDYAYIDLAGVKHPSVFDTRCRKAREVPHEVIAPRLCVCTDNLFDVLIQGYFIPTIVGMVRREVLGSAIRFRADLAYAEEWLFYLGVARTCRAGFVDEALCLHHFTAGSLARTDRRRNFRRYRDTLKAIDQTFSEMDREQRRPVRRELAQTCRQLGYDASRTERYREATGHFAESLRYELGARPLFETARAALMTMVPRGLRSPGDVSLSQGPFEVVR